MDLTDEEVKAGLVAVGGQYTGRIFFDPKTATWRTVTDQRLQWDSGAQTWSAPVNVGGPRVSVTPKLKRVDAVVFGIPSDGHLAYCDYCGRSTSNLVGQLWECDQCAAIGAGKPVREPLWLRALRWLASL
jgi:hypothetical protein